jgi:transglutaminase-like putative cysteine protease
LGLEALATFALAGFSLAVAAGFARVFSDWDFLARLAVIVAVGHLLPFVFRRLGVTGWVAVPVTALVLGVLVLWQNYGGSFAGIVPTRETWQLLDLDLALVREQFPTTVAPVVHDAGWATIAGGAMVLVVLLAELLAFWARTSGEALVPGGLLYVFVAALGYDRSRIGLTVVLVVAAVLAGAALRALHRAGTETVLTPSPARRAWAVPGAIGCAALVAVTAGLVGPRVPGAEDEPWVDTRGRSGGVTEVVSPLVDIRTRLVNQSNLELFRVGATEPSYWRVTSLPQFDGLTFSLPDRPLVRADGALSPARTDAAEIRQEVEIVELGGQLIPAAADPVAADGSPSLRWNPDTATLVVVGEPVERGDRFTIVSLSPRVSPDRLAAATSIAVPDGIHLELPADLPPVVTETARTVTAGATSGYAEALALQSFFRDGFTYSTEVQSGHGNDAMEVFLRDRVGYCEQFATAFAAMARTIGLPSRVAVGYTYGLQTPDGRYSVLGKNAHAWPEVWFDGIGWVPFEPTPGRGAPGTEQFTGVAAAQDDRPLQPGEPGSAERPEPAPPPTAPNRDDATNLDALLGLDGQAATDDPEEAAAPVRDEGGFSGWVVAAVAAALAVAAILPAVARRIARRRGAHGDPQRRVLRSWQRATRAVAAAGVQPSPGMTGREWTAATSAVLPIATRPMGQLAGTVDLVLYAPPGSVDYEHRDRTGIDLGQESVALARQVEQIAVDSMGPRDRLIRWFTTWS